MIRDTPDVPCGFQTRRRRSRPPGNFTSFFPPFPSKRHVTTSGIRDENRCARKVPSVLHAAAKAYVVNGCRLGSACKILIKVRYLAKTSLTAVFFLSLAEKQMLSPFFRFLKREFFNLLKRLQKFFYLPFPVDSLHPVEMRFDKIFTANPTINFTET